ncbi:MAG: type IV secretion system protein [Anaplasmataceae bacterium]|nr:type IV secretion system protein [Anaplasmataceae bacterium]
MQKIKGKLIKKKKTSKSKESNLVIENTTNWYTDQIQSLLIQRNSLFTILIALCIAISIGLFAFFTILNAYDIKPFIIEISKKIGIATLVNPVTVKEYSANESLNNHFIINYIKARELFDPINYKYNFYQKVRLFSSQEVYREFLDYIKTSNANSPFNLYTNTKKSNLYIKSLQFIKDDSVNIRFNLEFIDSSGKSTIKNKIATISFIYDNLILNSVERQINPLNFRITQYKIADEFFQ